MEISFLKLVFSPLLLDHCSLRGLGMTPGDIQDITLSEPGKELALAWETCVLWVG